MRRTHGTLAEILCVKRRLAAYDGEPALLAALPDREPRIPDCDYVSAFAS